MDTKLTLKLNDAIIIRAKKYASDKKLSLSRLVENYLDSITKDEKEDFEISPFVKSISTGKSIPTDFDHKEARREYINTMDEKYK